MSLKLLWSNRTTTTRTRHSSTPRAQCLSPVRCRCRTSPGPSCSCWRCIRCSSAASSGGFCPLRAAGSPCGAAGHVGRWPPEETKHLVSTSHNKRLNTVCVTYYTECYSTAETHWEGSNCIDEPFNQTPFRPSDKNQFQTNFISKCSCSPWWRHYKLISRRSQTTSFRGEKCRFTWECPGWRSRNVIDNTRCLWKPRRTKGLLGLLCHTAPSDGLECISTITMHLGV